MQSPAAQIDTERLRLRCWTPDDAPLLKAAVDMSLDHLREWLPWPMNEPSDVEVVRDRLASFQERFEFDEDYVYGVFDPTGSEVYGGAGLHPRIGPDALEIDYWIRVDQVSKGFATEVARALTNEGLGIEGIERIEIRCDPLNHASSAVPKKLGFRHVQTLAGDVMDSGGEPRDTMVWEMHGPD